MDIKGILSGLILGEGKAARKQIPDVRKRQQKALKDSLKLAGPGVMSVRAIGDDELVYTVTGYEVAKALKARLYNGGEGMIQTAPIPGSDNWEVRYTK